MKINSKTIAAFLLIIILQAACASNAQTETSPTGTPQAATPTARPLYQSVTLESIPFAETGKAPDYDLKAQTPVLKGSDDPRVAKFNKAAAEVVQKQIDEFRKMLLEMPKTPIVSGSAFDLQYKLLSPPGNIMSLKFDIFQYADGAAHPFEYSATLNYDLEAGKEISLERLFLPRADYLGSIAGYCKTELNQRDIGFDMFADGAKPTAENYRSWNITADGLMITFDEYQVAAYAAGPQVVVVPYAALKDIVDPRGPLAGFIK